MKKIVIAAVVALSLCVAVQASAQSCPPPQLISPADGARTTLPVTFEWAAVPGAISYEVFAAVTPNDIRFLGRTNATSFVLDHGLTGTFSWYIEADFPGCRDIASARRTITVDAAPHCDSGLAEPLTPASGATVTSPVKFSWRGVNGATGYRVLAAIGGGEPVALGQTTATSLEAALPAGTGYWMVQTFFGSNCPSTIGGRSLITVTSPCPTGGIALQSPAQNASVNAPVTLAWSALANVQAYRVTILTAGGTPVVRRTTSTQETFDLPAGEMSWYVEGLRDGCPAIVSDTRKFTVQRAASCTANQPPTLIAPTGTQAAPVEQTSPVTFTWNAANGAIGYRLWISRNGNAFEDIGITDKTQTAFPLPAGIYGWYLEAIFRGCDPVRSSTAYFFIRDTTARCGEQAPMPIAPAQGSTTTAPVTFSWTAVPGADLYRVFVSLDGSEERLIGTTTATTLTRVLPPGKLKWRVEAAFARCAATTSSPIEFTIPRAANCTDAKPQPVAPANDSTSSSQEITFSWTPVTGAVRYVVVARTEDGSPVPIGETTGTQLTRKLPFGRVEWSVIAFFAGCSPAESARARFAVVPPQNCPNRGPVLLLPSENSGAVYSPVTFAWSRVPNATGYTLWLARGDAEPTVAATTTENKARLELSPGPYRWYVEAKFANCPSVDSAIAAFKVNEPVACGTPTQPTAHVVGQALSGTPYRLRWTPLPNVDLYEVQESTSPTFENATTVVTAEPVVRFVHEVTGAPVQYLYRVRGVSRCNDTRGHYSDPVGVFVIPPRTNNSSAEVGVEGTIVQTLVLPASVTPLTFVAKVDKPWLTVTPSSGTVGNAPVTLTVTADPAFLALGTNTGTVSIEYTSPSSSSKVKTHATTTVTQPVSVSLVTPVTPTGKGTPPPDALIFPIVGHAAGVNDSLFESDIRIANLTPQTMKYQVNFTPSGTDGTQTGSSTNIEVAPNTTIALDDIVATVFGTGTISSALGMLEVRPLTTGTTNSSSASLFSSVTSGLPALSTAASSRTYNFTPNGTFGQFIPAIPFSKFASKGTVLSLLQVSQSAAYRANFGFAEAAGSPVELMVKVFNTKNDLLASIPISLGATQHTQINGMLAANGISDLADGRVEVEVVNGNGKVTAYVSSIDNKTNDPLLVNAVPKATAATNRWVVPGMAYINNGFAFWVSDLRIFNAGTTATPATVTFFPQGNGTPISKQITLDAGEIEVLDNVVGNLFALPNGAGGAIAITTPTNAQLHATARTYNQTANGTYGQFIPSVTVAESVGHGDRALQLLQLESSSRFRTNIGVTETSGNPVRVELIAIQPDSLVTPVITYDLAPGEFRQFSLADFFDAGAAVYNARVTVKVISGTGRVTAYGSAIDVVTQDPTYVPAQ